MLNLLNLIYKSNFSEAKIKIKDDELFFYVSNNKSIFDSFDKNVRLFINFFISFEFYEKLSDNKIQFFTSLNENNGFKNKKNADVNTNKCIIYGFTFKGKFKRFILKNIFDIKSNFEKTVGFNSFYSQIIKNKKLDLYLQTNEDNNNQSLFNNNNLYDDSNFNILTNIQLNLEKLSASFFIGQFNNQFFVINYLDSIVVIDQHALHERILLEELINKQNLTMYHITNDKDTSTLIKEFKMTACKNAITFNQVIFKEKACKLIRQIKNLRFPFICAHGRNSSCLINY